MSNSRSFRRRASIGMAGLAASNVSGASVTRIWQNPTSTTITKYINGRSGDTQKTGTANVWAHA